MHTIARFPRHCSSHAGPLSHVSLSSLPITVRRLCIPEGEELLHAVFDTVGRMSVGKDAALFANLRFLDELCPQFHNAKVSWSHVLRV